MSDERKPIGHLHVDPDAPGVVIKGDAVYIYPVDENGDPAEPPTEPSTLGAGWTDVGFTEEDAQRRLLDSLPVSTNWATRAMHIDMTEPDPEWSLRGPLAHASLTVDGEVSLSPAGIRALFGAVPPSSYAVQATSRIQRRPLAPRKARGLTGKRYRIARRAYARAMKRWRHGAGEPVEVRYYMSPASIAPIPGDPGAYSIGFRALDRGEPFVLPDLRDRDVSPPDAKPGYGGDHD